MDDVIRIMRLYSSAEFPREPGDVFIEQLTRRRDTWFVEAGDYGLIYLTNIVPGFLAQLNVMFWDKKLSGDRLPLVQAVVQRAVELFDLRRVQAIVYVHPSRKKNFFHKHPLFRFLRDVGFEYEGLMRSTFPFDGELYDTAVLSVLNTEVTWQLPTTSLE